jgi:hypothetical protein
MNPYLAKLRARSHEKRHPQEPSKPSKPRVAVVTRGDTTGKKGFEGFEGDGDRRSSGNEWASVAVKQTLSGRFCRAFQHLESRCPDFIPNDRWQQAVEDGRRFLNKWERTAAVGWTPRDLFGLHKPPDQRHLLYRRLCRYDETGVLWLLQGRAVVALTDATAAIENPTGAITIYRKFDKPALGEVVTFEHGVGVDDEQ